MDTFWGLTATDWTAIYTLITLLLWVTAVVTVVYAARQWRDTRAANLETMRPYVLATAEPLLSDRQVFDRSIRNIGQRPAIDVRVEIDPPPRRSSDPAEGPTLGKLRMLNEPIAMIAPGQDMRTLWDDHAKRHEVDLPWVHRVKIEYSDTSGHRFAEQAIIDLSAMCGTGWRVEKTIHDVGQAVERIARSSERTLDVQRRLVDAYSSHGDRFIPDVVPQAESAHRRALRWMRELPHRVRMLAAR